MSNMIKQERHYRDHVTIPYGHVRGTRQCAVVILVQQTRNRTANHQNQRRRNRYHRALPRYATALVGGEMACGSGEVLQKYASTSAGYDGFTPSQVAGGMLFAFKVT